MGKIVLKILKMQLKFTKSELIIICADTKLHYSIFKKVVSVYSPKAFIFENHLQKILSMQMKYTKYVKKRTLRYL